MKQLPSKERLEKIASWRVTYGAGHNVMLPAEEAEAMARALLAGMEREPVGYYRLAKEGVSYYLSHPTEKFDDDVIPLYAHPAPSIPAAVPEEMSQWIDDVVEYLKGGLEADGELEAEGSIEAKQLLSRRAAMLNGGKSERDKVRAAHAEWSQKMFGNVGPVGPLKHLAKEAIEAADAPDDLSEWADMQFLLWDAQRRAGITDKQINLAMIEKLAVNKTRSWPAPKDGEPRLHIKSAEGGSQ